MLDQHLQDGRHGEHVGDAVALDQPEGLVDVEALGRQQHGRRAARDLRQLVDARAVRQRRHHQRGVALGRAGHQVGEMVGDDEGHLAMGQHRRLGAAGGAGGEEEPARDRRARRRRCRTGAAGMARDDLAHATLAEGALADAPGEARAPALRGATAAAWSGKSPWQRNAFAPEAVARYATSSGIRRKFVGTQTAPSRKAANIDPNIASQFLRMHQDAVALADAARGAAPPPGAETRRRSRASVQVRSPQTKPGAVAGRRAFCVSMWPRFITRRDMRAMPPQRQRVSGSITWTAPEIESFCMANLATMFRRSAIAIIVLNG